MWQKAKQISHATYRGGHPVPIGYTFWVGLRFLHEKKGDVFITNVLGPSGKRLCFVHADKVELLPEFATQVDPQEIIFQ